MKTMCDFCIMTAVATAVSCGTMFVGFYVADVFIKLSRVGRRRD